MLLVVFVAVFVYDYLYKSGLAKNLRLITIISFVLIGGIVYSMKFCAGFDYRAFNIHLGAIQIEKLSANFGYFDACASLPKSSSR